MQINKWSEFTQIQQQNAMKYVRRAESGLDTHNESEKCEWGQNMHQQQ